MTRTNAFAIAAATMLLAGAASAESMHRDDTQAPRAEELQAAQAPRGQDDAQAPRGGRDGSARD